MALPKKKEKGWPRRERIIRPRYAHRERRKRPDIRRRVQSHEAVNVRELVYSLLNADKYNQERRERRGCNGGGFPGRIRKYRNVREPSYDSSVSIDESEYTKSAATSVGDLSSVMEAANSSAASSSGNSSVSNISVEPIVLAKSIDNTRALLKKKSLVQVINNYIRAGIEEGKRQAKKYIRKALSFGVKSGYLIPADPQGQMIRVASTLIESKKGDTEARKRRRKARRGENDTFVSDNEGRRATPPWNRDVKPYREATPNPEAPPKKRRKISISKVLKDASRTKRSPKKKVARRGRRGRSKGKITRKKSDEDQRQTRKKRSSQKRDTPERTEESKTRRGKSSRTRREEKDNSRKNRRVSRDEDNAKFNGDENENEKTPIGRRKSTTSREVPSRNGNEPDEHPTREHQEVLEDQNNANVQNNNTDNLN